MALYTIYLCREDGASATFEMHEALSDQQARALAQLVLEHHRTAMFANVWLLDRLVGRVDRLDGPPLSSQGAEAEPQ